MRTVFTPNNEILFQKTWQRLYDGGIPSIPPYAFLPWQLTPPTSSFLPWRRFWVFEPVYRMQRTFQMLGEVHICLDWQYDDAVNLLIDPHYIVENPVDLDEFEKHLAQISTDYTDTLRYMEDTIINEFFSKSALSGIGYGIYKILSG